MKWMRFVRGLLFAAVGVVGAGGVLAQVDYLNKPVKVLTGFPPG